MSDANPDFDTDWQHAPESMWTDRTVAEYWWWRGHRAGELAGVKQANDDLRELIERYKERVR